MKTVHAVYEKGVFRPTEQVQLPEHCEVEFEPRPVHPPATVDQSDAMQEVYKILSENVDTGIPDLAARHNEHQP